MNEDVKRYHADLLSYWIDPNGDGDFSDGVDGFRIDHMMDDLDSKGVLPHLFTDLWSPLLEELRGINPDVIFVAEQADWSLYGDSYFREGGVDAVFAFRIGGAIVSNDKEAIEAEVTKTIQETPAGKHQLLFLENHDTDRFASIVGSDPARLRSGAALVTLLYGAPSIYYGQEIGMRGVKKDYGFHDGNDIPRREAFEWYAEADGEGMTYWYRDSGPWWDDSKIAPHDGVSLEEQRGDGNSLWTYYRSLLALRSSKPALQTGGVDFLQNDHERVLTFVRSMGEACILVAVSLASTDADVQIDRDGVPAGCELGQLHPVPGWETNGSLQTGITLTPGQTGLWETH